MDQQHRRRYRIVLGVVLLAVIVPGAILGGWPAVILIGVAWCIWFATSLEG